MKKWLFFFSVFLFFSLFAQDQMIVEGEKLFKANCASCHKVDVAEAVLVGPGLLKTRERWAGKEELLKLWIKEPRKALATGDAYVKQLWDKYPSEMPGQAVNDQEIESILAYLDNPPAKKQIVANNTADSLNIKDDKTLPIVLMIFGAFLLIMTLILSRMNRQLKHLVAEKEGRKITEFTLGQRYCLFFTKYKNLLAVLGILIHLAGGTWLMLLLSTIAVTPGYHPSQPIAFSHQVHAGLDNAGIECLYCHSFAEKSKHAGIPSVEVCMNCHKGIQEGRNTGTSEIQKIYDAINFNPKTGQYGRVEDQKAIAWNKVHNLPDHVYFSHEQHVVMGKVACQTCHGKVEEMTTVSQHAPLTMGWCIDCHRNTEVPGYTDINNQYYQEIHARMDNASLKKIMDDGKVTVSELGGLECAKCHY